VAEGFAIIGVMLSACGTIWCFVSEKWCTVHRQRLQSDEVPIVYGLMRFEPEYRKLVRRSFPRAHFVTYGGCRINTEVQTRDVSFCPACREAYTEWAASVGRDPKAEQIDALRHLAEFAELREPPSTAV
jgi:hypothetical protein